VILRLLFIIALLVLIFWLVRRGRVSLDLAWLLFLVLVLVFGVSLSPWVVERLAHLFDFGTPAMAVVALAIGGLTGICLVLVIEVTALKRQHAALIRELAKLQLNPLSKCERRDSNFGEPHKG
jgi:hypothetical protein